MLSPRQQRILDAIVAQYIIRARPVPSQAIIDDRTLGVSSATVRNEMARLEEEGFILRPHTSAGSVPTDKGYRHYVQSIRDPQLPPAERRQLDLSFRTVDGEPDDWLNLAAVAPRRDGAQYGRRQQPQGSLVPLQAPRAGQLAGRPGAGRPRA